MMIDEQNINLKTNIVQSFSKALDLTMKDESWESKLAFGKQMALPLISVASIGLLIGFLISLFF